LYESIFVHDVFVFITLTAMSSAYDREKARGTMKEMRLSRVTGVVHPRL